MIKKKMTLEDQKTFDRITALADVLMMGKSLHSKSTKSDHEGTRSKMGAI